MHVFRSMVLNAPINRVWAMVRSFDGVVNWNPAVAAARMETGAPLAPGSIRHLDIADGSVFRETLLALSDADHFYTYDIIESPLPVRNYVSTHRFIPVTASKQTLGIWESRFDCDQAAEVDMDHVVGDQIYLSGMAALNTMLEEGADA